MTAVVALEHPRKGILFIQEFPDFTGKKLSLPVISASPFNLYPYSCPSPPAPSKEKDNFKKSPVRRCSRLSERRMPIRGF